MYPVDLKEEGKNKIPFYKTNKGGFDTEVAKKIKSISRSDASKYFELLDSNVNGLNADQVAAKRAIYGLNEISHEQAQAWYVQLLLSFIFPFNAVLVTIAVVSYMTDVVFASPADRDYKTIILLSVMILLSSLIRFWQEFRSNKAAETLKGMIRTTATVIRNEGLRFNTKKEIDIKQLVPGDVVFLSAGDMIPADCRIIQCKDLFISQSMLTGESLPIEKRGIVVPDAETKSPLDLENICFMGTNVASGTANAIVVMTGNLTYFGSLSKAITNRTVETSFDKGVKSVSYLLIRFMMVMVPLVFVINGLTKGNWVEALLFAISVAVGLTPEMLPMIVTTNLAKGAMNMSRQKVIVKRLNAIQNIGAMDVLCTDKTGTLTLDKIVLTEHLNVDGDHDDEVLKWAYLNSYHQSGLKNLLDVAVLDHSELHNLINVEGDYKKLDEIPFDFQRRRMSVILQMKNGRHLLICKGAVEEMLGICSYAFDPGEDKQLHIERDKIVPMDNTIRQVVLNTSNRLNESGLRVLLVAIKEFDERPLTYSVADETNLALTGFIGFLDPAKPSAKPSIEALQRLGISLKVLTGDNEIVTKKICRDVGVTINNILLGNELDTISDEELTQRIDDINIFAKLSPFQKSRIIKVLQAKGYTVGFMGDGINDAAALRDSDVGISVDTAVDIAKESADIILLEKDLMVLYKGVIYGRRTFGNIIKYIKMAASSNFGNMFSVLGASALLPFLPMLPIQILLQNLLYDISQISIPWDKMDRDYLEVPRKWDSKGIGKFMLFIGPISSVFDYVTFAVMFFFFKANAPQHQALFQSGWFIEGLLSQTLIVHMIRTKKIPFIQSWATAPVVALTSAIMALAVFIPFSSFASVFKMQPLPLGYFPWLFAILICYCLLTQMVKTWFIKKFHTWL